MCYSFNEKTWDDLCINDISWGFHRKNRKIVQNAGKIEIENVFCLGYIKRSGLL